MPEPTSHAWNRFMMTIYIQLYLALDTYIEVQMGWIP